MSLSLRFGKVRNPLGETLAITPAAMAIAVADGEDGETAYSLSGASGPVTLGVTAADPDDAERIVIDPQTATSGVFRLLEGDGFVQGGDNEIVFRLTATDSQGTAQSQDITMTITEAQATPDAMTESQWANNASLVDRDPEQI